MRVCDRASWTWTAQWVLGSSPINARQQLTMPFSLADPLQATSSLIAILTILPNHLPGSLSPFTPPTVVSALISQILLLLVMTAAVNCPGSTQVSLFFSCRLVVILPRRNFPLIPSLGEHPLFCCPIHPHPC